MDILLFDNDVNFSNNLKDRINKLLVQKGFDNDCIKTYRNAELLLNYINDENKVRIFFIGVNFKYNFIFLCKCTKHIIRLWVIFPFF